MRRLWLLLALVSGCRGEIPVVGLDTAGNSIETKVSKRHFVSHLTSMVNDMTESVMPVVDSDDYGRQLSSLRSVRLGLGIRGSFGLGGFWKLGGNLGFSLHFTNKEQRP